MSYIRSALYLLLGGFTLLNLKQYAELHVVGYVALGLCLAILVIGIYRYVRLRRQLIRYYTDWLRNEEISTKEAS